MKNKLACFALLLGLFSFGCKKDLSEDITAYNWVLKTQIASPAVTLNGKTSTDYLSLQNPEGCTKNYTFVFYTTGIFTVGSNGSLCDMLANSEERKWKREGDQIVLNYDLGTTATTLTIKGNTLTQISDITLNGSTHAITSIYIAQKK